MTEHAKQYHTLSCIQLIQINNGRTKSIDHNEYKLNVTQQDVIKSIQAKQYPFRAIDNMTIAVYCATEKTLYTNIISEHTTEFW